MGSYKDISKEQGQKYIYTLDLGRLDIEEYMLVAAAVIERAKEDLHNADANIRASAKRYFSSPDIHPFSYQFIVAFMQARLEAVRMVTISRQSKGIPCQAMY